MATPQKAIFNGMGQNQWYVHLSRTEGADLGVIKSALADLRAACDAGDINLTLGFGPTLLADLSDDMPADFQAYVTIESTDGSGRQAKGTQEELLLWLNHDDKGRVWKAQYDCRKALEGHMSVARETPTFIYGESLDMTGFKDGTGNPADEDQPAVACVPDGEPGAGGSFIIAQRWIHDLDGWNALPDSQQEANFGRKKFPETDKTDTQEPYSHLSHVELRSDGAHGSEASAKRNEIARRSTPYAFHDGSVGLYFMAFCKDQAPLRERMRLMYGLEGNVRDAITDFSNPASGSYYFAPSTETLNSITG
jgi:porphyrinogen peroxidase